MAPFRFINVVNFSARIAKLPWSFQLTVIPPTDKAKLKILNYCLRVTNW